jgi:hypothetical protein
LENADMAEAVILDTETDLAGNLVAIVEKDATPFLTDTNARRDFMDQVRSVASSAGTDVSTSKSRADIVSLAAKVTRCKTTIDGAGKAMTEEWRAKTNAVNEARKEIRDEFTQLAAEIRRPVSDWEEAERQREETAKQTLTDLRAIIASPAPMGATADDIRARIAATETVEIDAAIFGEDTEFAQSQKAQAIDALKGALASVEKAEAEKAELEELRRAAAEREAKDRAEAEAREAKAREEAEAKARAEREAEEAQRREAEAKARQAEAERLAAEAAEKARQEERERIEAEARAKQEADAKAAAAAERKAQNKRHRARILAEVAEALETQFKLDGGQSQLIADAIAGGHVPHTSIQF